MIEESLDARIARIDERTELMLAKLNDLCDWKNGASKDLHTLKSANLIERVTALEGWRWYIIGVATALSALISIMIKIRL